MSPSRDSLTLRKVSVVGYIRVRLPFWSGREGGSALRDTSSVRSPSTVPSSSSASRHRRALALSNQTTSKPAEADLSVASETLWTGLPSLTSRALTRLRSVVSQMTGGSRASDASHECASSHKEPTLTQNLPRRASGVSTPGIAKQIRGAPPGIASTSVLSAHNADFRIASRSLMRSYQRFNDPVWPVEHTGVCAAGLPSQVGL